MNMNLSKRQQGYVDSIIEHAPSLGIDLQKDDFSRAELRQVSMAFKGKIWIPNWITHDQSRRSARGIFNIPEVQMTVAANAPAEEPMEMVDIPTEEHVLIEA